VRLNKVKKTRVMYFCSYVESRIRNDTSNNIRGLSGKNQWVGGGGKEGTKGVNIREVYYAYIQVSQ
jgi:hypothetical protein